MSTKETTDTQKNWDPVGTGHQWRCTCSLETQGVYYVHLKEEVSLLYTNKEGGKLISVGISVGEQSH